MNKTESTLLPKLEEKKNSFNQKAAKEKKDAYERGIQSIISKGILDKSLKNGAKAPDFSLKNATGNDVKLSELLKNGPVILLWYRGGWCPYCNITLNEYQLYLSKFKKYGAQLVAISPELPDKSITTKEINQLDFEVLSDVNNLVARSFGITFELTPEVSEYYKQSFSYFEYYGYEGKELPLAATYVIDQEGIIRWTFLDADYRNRAEPVDILEFLQSM